MALLFHLGHLLERGYSLRQSIELLSVHRSTHEQATLQALKARLRKGESFADILKSWQFPNMVLGILAFSEHHRLASGILESAQLMQKKADLIATLIKLLRYPLVLSGFVLLFFVIIFRHLLPQFQSLYDSLDMPLPVYTVFYLKVMEHGLTIAITFVGIVVLMSLPLTLIYRRKTPHQRLRFWYAFPLLRTYFSFFYTYLFAIQMSALLKSGLSIKDVLDVWCTKAHQPFFKAEAMVIRRQLAKGLALEDVISDRVFYDRSLTQIVRHGQQTGRLAEELELYGEMLFATFEEKLRRHLMLVQPLLFLGIGLILISLFLAVMLPMYTFMNGL